MPYDPVPEAEDLSFASGDEGLLRLARLLEREEEWRGKVLEWNFRIALWPSTSYFERPQCSLCGCAIGLASLVWPEFSDEDGGPIYRTMKHFNLTLDQHYELFGDRLSARLRKNMRDIAPGEVAAGIRAFVARRRNA